MKLITPELEQRFKEIGDQSEVENPIVVAKFFDPTGQELGMLLSMTQRLIFALGM